MRLPKVLLIIVAIVSAFLTIIVNNANADIYWHSAGGTISRANSDGTQINNSIFQRDFTLLGFAANNSYIYFDGAI